METLLTDAVMQHTHGWRGVVQTRAPQDRKRVKGHRGDSRGRNAPAALLPGNTDETNHSCSAALSQPIIISDTPSPALSIITIHSDTDTEDDRKFHPASYGVTQRANVISCVTVHDSDSSTASPLTPRPHLASHLPPSSHLLPSSGPTRSLAVVAPSLKSQPSENLATSGYMKPKRTSNRQPCSSGEGLDRLAPSQSHPLNLSQVQPVVSTSQDRSVRRQQTCPPASHYSFQEVAPLASAPGLYSYPASAALASASQALEQLLGPALPAYPAPRRDPGRKDGLVPTLPTFQHPFSGSPYISVTPRAEAYGAYQLSPHRLPQYPYL